MIQLKTDVAGAVVQQVVIITARSLSQDYEEFLCILLMFKWISSKFSGMPFSECFGKRHQIHHNPVQDSIILIVAIV